MHMLQEAKQQQQAFTKRKRTIMDKAFELSQAADAKVGDLMIGSAEQAVQTQPAVTTKRCQ